MCVPPILVKVGSTITYTYLRVLLLVLIPPGKSLTILYLSGKVDKTQTLAVSPVGFKSATRAQELGQPTTTSGVGYVY